jgi:uncharacterized coiled-coil protein SlyX
LRIVELETAAEFAATRIAELETVVSAVPVVIEPDARIVELETAAEFAANLIAELEAAAHLASKSQLVPSLKKKIAKLEDDAAVESIRVRELEASVFIGVPSVVKAQSAEIKELKSAAEVAASLIAELQTAALDDPYEGCRQLVKDLRIEIGHYYQARAEIASDRITELEAQIAILDAVVVPVVVEPVAPVDTLPRGYSFEGATTTVNNVSYRVVRGPNMGYHTLRAPLVLKRLSAAQFSRMVQDE